MISSPKIGMTVKFGGFEAYRIKETPLQSITQAGLTAKELNFTFEMIGESVDGWKIECKSSETAKPGLDGSPVETLSRELSCRLEGPQKDIWRLRFSASRHSSDLGLGELRATRKRVSIHGVSETQNKLKIAGYGMALLNRPVSAIQTAGEPRIWLVSDLSNRLRSAIGAGSVALLIFDDILNR